MEEQFTVQRVSRGVFRTFNKTSVPFIYFEVPKDQSILKPFFNDTSVKDDETLTAKIYRRGDYWFLSIEGELEKCPGRFYKKRLNKIAL